MGSDYHLLLKNTFLGRLEEAYRTTNNLNDPVWTCQLYLIFALGELYSAQTGKMKDNNEVPGSQYFLRAMSLFQDVHEETTVPYIETLLLIVSCSFGGIYDRKADG